MTPDALAIALNDADAEVVLAGIARVAENPEVVLSESSFDALLRCLGANRKAIQRRAAEALAAIASHDERVVAKLRTMLSHDDARMRWGVAYALGLVHEDGALDLAAMPNLVEAMSSADGDVRWAAAELVVRLGKEHRDAVSTRLLALAGEDNPNARKMALYCLRDVGGARDALLAIAEACCADHHSIVRMAALSLLTRIGNPGERAANAAMGLLENDPDAGVRRCAAVALGHLSNHSARVTEALMRAANANGDVSMQRAARGALARLGATV
ncbi:MAG TPA: HEAT repeat domain-containing protein [Candidatus Binataceae bacterium]|nr:HEAT repeat domain-containing protein [Candidatus Binataceae bacterium]